MEWGWADDDFYVPSAERAKYKALAKEVMSPSPDHDIILRYEPRVERGEYLRLAIVGRIRGYKATKTESFGRGTCSTSGAQCTAYR